MLHTKSYNINRILYTFSKLMQYSHKMILNVKDEEKLGDSTGKHKNKKASQPYQHKHPVMHELLLEQQLRQSRASVQFGQDQMQPQE